MTQLSKEQQDLSRAWNAIYEGSGQAVQWVEAVSEQSSEVAGVADDLLPRLYQARNLARSLQRVATTPMGVGFFGLSQAGKSHLINTLAADARSQLESQFGHHNLNFEDHVNPQGGGAEATGLVTRFTRQATPSADPAFPVELRLFREIEIAMVLINAWFEEFDHDQEAMAAYKITDAMVQPVLSSLQQRASHGAAGVLPEDVAALHEYVKSHYFGKTEALRRCGFWPQAIKLAPRLSVAERAQLFSVLWGQEPKLTETYTRLAGALDRVGRAEVVFAALNALVTEREGKLVRESSIMSVNTLHQLGNAGAPMVQLRPMVDGQLQSPVMLSVAEVTALTSELVFRLVNEPRNAVVNSVDLLDFPGYRTRSKMPSLDKIQDKDNSISNLLLRGKVAYLFERYTAAQEMNALVLCTSSIKQSEVIGVERVLEKWIHTTQGATPAQRGRHAPGLIWVLTMGDEFAKTAISGAETGYAEACKGLIKLTMQERFGKEEWMQEWAPGKPFSNTYLTRAPQFTSFTRKEAGSRHLETELDPDKAGMLQKLGEVLAETESCQRHIAQPAAAWNAMMALNDGGMSRFSASFEPVADVSYKLDRIREQLHEVQGKLIPRLQAFYEAGGEAERAKQKTLANQIVKPFLGGKSKYVIGELLSAMSVPAADLRDLYLSGNFDDVVDTAAAGASADAAPASAVEEEFDIFGAAEQAAETGVVETQAAAVPEWQSHVHKFARAAVDLWIQHLRALPEREGLLQWLGLPKESVAGLVREMVRSAERLGVPEQLAGVLLQREQHGLQNSKLVDRHVLTTRLMLDDFSAWFGSMHLPVSSRPVGLLGARRPLFSFLSAQVPQGLPALPAQVTDYGALYADDWLSSVAIHTQNNTGHRKGREISPEQNAALGKVLDVMGAGMEQGAQA